MSNPILSEPELRRFDLQMHLSGIGREGQEKIKSARIAVIGAGGTGASVLQNLAACGIGYLGIIDDGLVNEINIQRQTLYGGTDLGKLKTIISRHRLQQLFPMSTYQIINLRLTSENMLPILRPFHFVVDATNNAESSLMINDACTELQKPWVYANVSGYTVNVSVFNDQNNTSFRNISRLHKNPDESSGAISFAYALAGVFATVEVLKIITGDKETLGGRLLTFDTFRYRMNIEDLGDYGQNFNAHSQTFSNNL